MSEIKLSDHFSISGLLRFTFPTMMMMVFYNTYLCVDGLFISNFVGSTAYAAVNIVGNYVLLFPVIGTMLGSGGAALISKTLGEKKGELASDQFSTVTWTSIALAVILTTIGVLTVVPAARMQGARGELLEYCRSYGLIVTFTIGTYVVQSEFQYFFAVVEKEALGFVSALIAGFINISLDALFILVFGWGLRGAAIASLLGSIFAGVFPIAYFLTHRDLAVRLKKPGFDPGTLLRACTNGLSEMVVNVSLALVGILFNVQLMRYAGEDGVAAYGVIQAITAVFLAVFAGYSAGVIPVIGYHFGDRNKPELISLLRKSLVILTVTGVIMFVISEALAKVFAGIFVGYDRELLETSVRGLRIYGTVFLVTGCNVFGSAFFTGLNDGLNSAVISVSRTMVLLVACVLLLPLVWGLDGIWISTAVAEALSLIVTFIIFLKNKIKWA
mgnify:CR=1 FL=1